MIDFSAFGLNETLLKTLKECNILFPNHLQQAVIPQILTGKDILIDAPPGRGRTLAFAIPILGKILDSNHQSRGIIVTESQETCFNLEKKIRPLARLADIQILVVYSGLENIETTVESFMKENNPPHIIIGEPLSLYKYITSYGFDISKVEFFLLAFDDQKMDSTFINSINSFIQLIKPTCQRILVTSKGELLQQDFVQTLLRSPSIFSESSINHSIEENENVTAQKGEDEIEHRLYMCIQPPKEEEIERILRIETHRKTLVIMSEEERVGAFVSYLKSLNGFYPVLNLRDIDWKRPLPQTVVVVASNSDLSRCKTSFNSLILYPFPENYENYINYMKLLKKDSGDRIISIATSRNISEIFHLKLHYGITPEELAPPSDLQLESELEAQIVKKLEAFCKEPDESMLKILRRVRTSLVEDNILAEGLRLLVENIERGEVRTEPHTTRYHKEQPDHKEKSKSNRVSSKTRHDLVELRLNLGREDGLDGGFIIQWLQSRLAMRSSEFGPVKVFDHSAIISVPADRAVDAIGMLTGLNFSGKTLEAEQITPKFQKKR